MFKNFLATATVAGIAVGFVLTALQLAITSPIIIQAEIHESGGSAAARSGSYAAIYGAPGESLSDIISRHALTGLSTVLAAIGFALVLIAAMVLNGRPIDGRSGLLWGLGGFAAVTLAPSLGLAPGLPGSASAVLGAVQIWWLGTAAATAAGLWLLFFKPRPAFKSAGLALIAAPHLIGAPMPDQFTSTAPAELAGAFASASIVLGAVFWALLGWATGTLWPRFADEVADETTHGASTA
ncbi:Predicted cobalt transporter CbtA [hydrothermal vent metagenome]|uniref:Predicted cobalt transporter CbtA n=1 Tax=hydrothermal vent metagenome TaxID=652676 RepID=A0A3B0SWW5_9ZZZZ